MNIENVTNLYQLYNDDGIIISYHGTFLQEMIEDISLIINNRLNNYSNTITNRRYLGLFIELAQNILRYSANSIVDNEGNHISHGLILVGVRDGKIFVISGNPINKDNEIIVKDRLGDLKNYSKDELNKLFKEKLRSKDNKDLSSTPGLGLIDITRKSDNMEYHFSKLDSGETFFTIKVEYKL